MGDKRLLDADEDRPAITIGTTASADGYGFQCRKPKRVICSERNPGWCLEPATVFVVASAFSASGEHDPFGAERPLASACHTPRVVVTASPLAHPPTWGGCRSAPKIAYNSGVTGLQCLLAAILVRDCGRGECRAGSIRFD